ncbi:class I SAM-dependent methyltransferase [Halotalea alkalilenta]|uniref:class I SAM-dependent methyltransferase n=1 Tax=Halotalea alkalilenta TaxID=376489 RepID=UPI000AD5513B|nr:class I SAM-dependent methyltransferase [Halotalea alkalilenta]
MNLVALQGDPARIEALAARYGLACGGDARFTLRLTSNGLELAGGEAEYGAPVRVDFVAGRADHRRRFGGGRGQLVARACGFKPGVVPSIIDATAGLGRDAFVLASLGAQVLMIERVGAIAALLEDGLNRAALSAEVAPIAARMRLSHGDAAQRLAELVAASDVVPQVVHLDPMFPHRDKRALVKKEMRLFRELAGADDDAPRLLEAALDVATHRVVVKRPKGAPSLAGPAPQHVVEEKNSRYDLYVHRALR